MPDTTIVPPITSLFNSLFTGILSPVIILSSIVAFPLIITPSTAILSPVLIKIISPTIMSSNSTSTILLSLSTLAVVFCISESSFIDVVVFFTLLCSNRLPNNTRVIMVAEVSKNKNL